MLRRHGVIAVGLVLAAGLLGAAGCTSDKPEPGTSSAPAPTGRVDGSTAPDGGEIRVVESGFSFFPDGSDQATFGVVLENTSKGRAAVDVKVTVRFTDAAGKPVRLGTLDSMFSKSVTVLPGKRAGAGQDVTLSRKDLVGDPAQMKVEMSTLSWYPVADVAGIAISGTRFERDTHGLVTFTVSADSQLTGSTTDPHLVVIVRDRDGKLIGGYEPNPPKAAWPPGASTQVVTTGAPTTVDLSRSEVYAGQAELRR